MLIAFKVKVLKFSATEMSFENITCEYVIINYNFSCYVFAPIQ